MAPFPLNLSELLGHWPSFLVYMVIGFFFGYALEVSGFGKSTKLAAQFYFKELTVFKVMFTAIVVAMIGVFLASALGLLDYNLIWVNPTYLWPGIVGGLIMGVGFIVGGFCPGTSLVSAATGKLDGMFFVGGVFFGIFLFGETVGLYEDFWNSSFMGRFTLMDLFNTSAGVLVLVITILAIIAFFFAEQAEKYIGGMNIKQFGKWRFGAAGALVLVAGAVLVIGQPTNADKWNAIEGRQQPRIDERAIYAHPVEILSLMEDPKLTVKFIDVRNETDYNLFHVLDSERVDVEDMISYAKVLNAEPANTVFVLAGNGEERATEAWKVLVAESVPNVYILEGGINNWIDTFSDEEFKDMYATTVETPGDVLNYTFATALGSRYPAANPNYDVYKGVEFTKKVELQVKRGPASGGCG